MMITLTTIQGLSTSRFILHIMVFCVVCCLPAVSVAQTTPVAESIQVHLRVLLEGLLIDYPEIVMVSEIAPLSIITPPDSTTYHLSTGDANGTTVTLVVEASPTNTSFTMTLELNDGGTSIVSLPTSPITFTQAADDNTQRTAQFKLTAMGAGNTTLTIVVSDSFGNKDEVQVRVAVIPLSIITPPDSTTYHLSAGDANGTTVTLVVEASPTNTSFTMTLELNDGGTSIVSIPTSPITFTQAADDNTQRTAQFKLTAMGAGNTTLTIVVSDSFGNKDEVQVRVAVIPLSIITPPDSTTYHLSASDANGTTVTLVVEASPTNTSVTMTLELNDGGTSIVSLPTSPITFTQAADDNTRRTAQFKLTAMGAGNTTLTIVVSDSFGNKDEVQVRVAVIPLESDMVIVPAGSFTMGSPVDEVGRYSREVPQHQVTISQSFAVGKYEVTRGQFKAFIDATEYDAGSAWRNPGFEQTDAHPVVHVSWNDAQAYVDWLSASTKKEYRLLSEAEWEYVARAGTTTTYHFGNTISQGQANYDGHNGGTVAVGSYSANAFGLHDVHGNVWEWVEDCWHSDYTDAPSDGSAWGSDCHATFSGYRVLRGGSWHINARNLRSAVRSGTGAGDRGSDTGFRIARTLTP